MLPMLSRLASDWCLACLSWDYRHMPPHQFFYFYFLVLEIKLRALHVLDQYSTTEPQSMGAIIIILFYR
jgi:hypothetical protein